MFDPLIDHAFVHTPSAIDAEVIAFCATLNANSKPVRMTPQPSPGAVAGECYANVDRAITNGLGIASVSGWLIWRWHGVFVEAEHHMVLDIGGSLVDVTPALHPADTDLVFLPDPTTPFDPATRKLIRNRNRTLGYEPFSREYLEAGARLKAMHGDVFGEYQAVDVDEYRAAQFAAARAKDALLKKIRSSLGRNDLCLCGSGKKYKRCHATN